MNVGIPTISLDISDELLWVEELASIEIINLFGQSLELLTVNLPLVDEIQLDLSDLPAGLYIARVHSKHFTWESKLIKTD